MKKLSTILPLALILCFMVGCQDKEAMAEFEAMKAQAKVEEQNKELAREVWEEWGKGEFMGIPATGNKYEISGIWISRIENGKIVEQREELDMLGLYQQLGMELKPKGAEK
jgi:predicted ester cyclase